MKWNATRWIAAGIALAGTAGASAGADNALAPIAAKMEEVKEKHLDAAETGPIAQRKIDGILDDIQALIDQAAPPPSDGDGDGDGDGAGRRPGGGGMRRETPADKGTGIGLLGKIFSRPGEAWSGKFPRDPEKGVLLLRRDSFSAEYQELLRNYYSALNAMASR